MLYVFGTYELDIQCYELRTAGKPLKVEPKIFDVLSYLILHRDNIVSKDELLNHLWPNHYISEVTLSGCIMEARRVVGDNGRLQRVIQTVRGRGYRFIAPLAVYESGEPGRQAPPPAELPSPTPAASDVMVTALPQGGNH
jgi:DNA-binding winged helix-turn-helix (wHTH) protein